MVVARPSDGRIGHDAALPAFGHHLCHRAVPGLIVLALRPERLKLLKQPAPVWIVGIAGLFGYHFLYFTALRSAPAVEAA